MPQGRVEHNDPSAAYLRQQQAQRAGAGEGDVDLERNMPQRGASLGESVGHDRAAVGQGNEGLGGPDCVDLVM